MPDMLCLMLVLWERWILGDLNGHVLWMMYYSHRAAHQRGRARANRCTTDGCLMCVLDLNDSTPAAR